MKAFTTRHPLTLVLAARRVILRADGIALPSMARSHNPEQTRIRGSIVPVDANALKVKTRDGKTVDAALAGGAGIVGVVHAAIGDIKAGDFAWRTAQPGVLGRSTPRMTVETQGGYREDRGDDW